MPDQITQIDYFYLAVSDQDGGSADVLATMQAAGVHLLGFSTFPRGTREFELDLIPEDSAAFRKAARTAGFKLSRKKSGFWIQGEQDPGAMADAARRLADAHIKVISAQVFSAGSGRYGGMLWVGAPDLRRAAKALGAAPRLKSKPAPAACNYPSPFDEM